MDAKRNQSADYACSAAARTPMPVNSMVSTRLQTVLPFLTAAHLPALAAMVFEGSEPAAALDRWLISITGVASLVSWMLLRRNRFPALANQVAYLLAVLILGRSLVKLHVAADFSQIAILVPLLIGTACILPTGRGWVSVVAGPALAGWIIIGAWKLPQPGLSYSFFTLAATAVLAGLGLQIRLRRQHRAGATRVQEADRTSDEAVARERFAAAAQGTQDGLWYWDLKSNVFHFCPAWEALLGYEHGELVNKDPEEWFSRVHPGYLVGLKKELSRHLQGTTSQFSNEHRLRTKDGSYLWVSARGTAIRNDAGDAVALAGSHRDIAALIEVDRRELNDSFHDKLTGLPNRDFLMARLDRLMEQKRSTGSGAPLFAVLFLDLDRFKVINDSLGHLVGDQLLVAVSGRLQKCVRPEDVVARFGGDEFVVLLENVRNTEEAMAAGSRIRDAFSNPFEIGGHSVTSGASVGVVLSHEAIGQTQDLLRFADMAMYHAKTQRKGQVQLYDKRMHTQATRLCDLQNDLARAVERNQLVLHYQPYVSTNSGKILGVEALLRWQRSKHELLAPGEFVPLAEEMGIIHEMGEWVLRTACAQNHAWQRAGLPPVPVAVNLSARQLQEKDFSHRVLSILEQTHLAARCLELELT